MKNCIIIIFCFLPIISKGQVNDLFGEVNYNGYQHEKLKLFQEELKESLNFPAENTDMFPTFWGGTFGYMFEIENYTFDVFVSHQVTGGKISYSDYSGTSNIFLDLKSYSFGGSIYFPVTKKESYAFYYSVKTLCRLSYFDIRQEYRIYDEFNNDKFQFESLGFGVGLNLFFEKKFGFIKIRARAGYDLCVDGKFKYSRDKEVYLQNDRGDNVMAEWSGLRISIGLSIPLTVN